MELLQIPEDLHQRLSQFAESCGMTTSQLIESWLDDVDVNRSLQPDEIKAIQQGERGQDNNGGFGVC